MHSKAHGFIDKFRVIKLFVMRLLSELDIRASWIQLHKLRSSFLSKAITAFSLATFGLANFAVPLNNLGMDLSRLKLMFVGSTLFLLGYVLMIIRTPAEFQDKAELHEIVDHMLKIGGFEFFSSRLNLIQSLIKRSVGKGDLGQINGFLQYATAQASVADTKTLQNWQESAASLYHADLALRQYDRSYSRLVALFFFIIGLLLLLIPTLISVVRATFSLLTK
jgi:hypothetical protein